MPNLSALPAAFYDRPTPDLARALLGRMLVHDEPHGGTTGGIIVETEAYLPTKDPGCHAARGQTPRNSPMFGPAGTAYVYLIYGVHHCLNVVAEPEGIPGAVLIRALEPAVGVQEMLRRRGVDRLRDCCSGPGKLCQALGIGLEHNETDLTRLPLFIADPPEGYRAPGRDAVTLTTRIGLRVGVGDDLPLRYYLTGSPHVSRKR